MKIKDREEFREIAHSGGQVTIQVRTDPVRGRICTLQWVHSRPVPAALFEIHVLYPGVPVGTAVMGGIGSPVDRGPVPGCIRVMIGSDSEGLFGRCCHACQGYWRSNAPSGGCPYCGVQGESHHFLTDAQSAYVQQFCELYSHAAGSDQDGDYVIDFDAVADAVGEKVEKPPFYYAEESQQNKFRCEACDTITDILGRFGYCTWCGTRNDLQELENKTLADIRNRINSGGPYEACVRDAVSAFDSTVSQYVKQLTARVPLTNERKNRLSGRFHNLETVAEEMRGTFDINLLAGFDADEQTFASRMFFRRHVYEHNGGEADEKYITQSGDNSIRPKQALRETQESAHRLVSAIAKLARNLHRGFHTLFPARPHRTRRQSAP